MASRSDAAPSTRLAQFITRYRELVLALGAIAGLIAALSSIVAPTERALTFGSVVAYVNDGTILRADYDRALALLQSDRREPLTAADRKQVLSRLIEEELLVQRARNLGLTQSDPTVRKILIRTMLDTVATQGRPAPGESELRSYYESKKDLFQSPPMIHVARIVVKKDVADVEQRLLAIRSSLTPANFAETKSKFSDPEIVPLPDAPIPAAKLRDYVGQGVIERILAMHPGAISEPIDTGSTLEIFELVSREQTTPAYEDIADEVAARYAREQDETALDDYLARLRASAEIEIDSSLEP